MKQFAVLAALVIGTSAGAQQRTDTLNVTVDTVFLARDLNGNGKADFVVREQRPFDDEMVMKRMSVYLDGTPAAGRAPHWASSWDENLGGPSWLDTTIAVPGGTLAQISINDADAVTLIVLHIRERLVTPAILKQIDYGEGTVAYRQSRDTVVVLVTSPATMDGQQYSLDATGRCNGQAEWPAMRFAFDATQRRLMRTSGFECVRKYYVDQPEWTPPPFSADSTILARDLDGNRLPDHLVVESRLPHPRERREYRMVLYMDAPPNGREPENLLDSEREPIRARIDTTIPVPGGTLLVVKRQREKNSEVSSLFLLQKPRGHYVGGLQIDNGDGSFALVPAKDSIVVEATALSLGAGDWREPPKLCPAATQWTAWRFAYHSGTRSFVRLPGHVCIPRRNPKQPSR